MLRETLKKTTVPDLIEKCQAAAISGYTHKRKEELIDLLVRKKPRLDEQVYYSGVLDATGLLGAALCGLCLMACTALRQCRDARDIMQAYRPPAPPAAAKAAPAAVDKDESMVLIARYMSTYIYPSIYLSIYPLYI